MSKYKLYASSPFVCHKVVLGFCIFNRFLIWVIYVRNLLCGKLIQVKINQFCSEVLKTNFLHYALLCFYQLTEVRVRNKRRQRCIFAQLGGSLQCFCRTCRLLLTSECKMHDTLNSVYCKPMKTKGEMKAHGCGREGEEVEKKNSDAVMKY